MSGLISNTHLYILPKNDYEFLYLVLCYVLYTYAHVNILKRKEIGNDY